MPQGNSLCSNLKQAKMSFFLFCFFLYKIRSCLKQGGWYQWERGGVGKWWRRVNMVYVNAICWSYSRKWGGRYKWEWWKGWI
jgi:hypothetical protein